MPGGAGDGLSRAAVEVDRAAVGVECAQVGPVARYVQRAAGRVERAAEGNAQVLELAGARWGEGSTDGRVVGHG